VEAFPRSKASLAFKRLALVADRWSPSHETHGQLQFFLERLLQADHPQPELQS
jgi:flagellar biosynthesis protein FlhG